MPRRQPKDIGAVSQLQKRHIVEQAIFDDHPGSGAEARDARMRATLISILVALRKLLGINQAHIAAKVGTAQSAISEFEKGFTDPRLSTIQLYARALGLEAQVALTSSYGTIYASWNDRSPEYDRDSVRPIQIDESRDLWLIAFQDKMDRLDRQRDFERDLREQGVSKSIHLRPTKPMEAVEDRYLTAKEIVELRVIQSVYCKLASA